MVLLNISCPDLEDLFYSGRDSCSLSPLRPDKEIGPNSRKKEAEHSG